MAPVSERGGAQVEVLQVGQIPELVIQRTPEVEDFVLVVVGERADERAAILLVNCSDICQKTSDMDPHTAHKGRGRPHTFENTASFEM
jgi:hypothetical protein